MTWEKKQKKKQPNFLLGNDDPSIATNPRLSHVYSVMLIMQALEVTETAGMLEKREVVKNLKLFVFIDNDKR